MIIKGRVWKFGDNIDTDVIIPARYLNTSEPQELAKHLMEDLDKEFSKRIKKGDIILAGKNFGCGSSREHAPIAIKAAGISAVIARSYARIFYRNSFNIGLPIFESEEAYSKISEGDIVEIYADIGKIKNLTKNEQYTANKIPPFMKDLLESGGLIEWTKKIVKEKY